MSFPILMTGPTASPTIPRMVRDLGPAPVFLFAVLHLTTAIRCLKASALLSTRELLSDPAHKSSAIASWWRTACIPACPNRLSGGLVTACHSR